MKLAGSTFVAIALALASGTAVAGAARFGARPAARRAGGKTQVTFTLSARTDIEVAILDAGGKVVRHLAAGVLGAKTPPPAPLKPGLSQSVEWDGKDDYGKPAKGAPFKVRVRAGMGVKLKTIVGGDPYAYYSREMGQGDHATWCITGLDAKSDGKVYVLGNACNIGPPAIRQYDAEGNYVKTVFPPPAGLPAEEVKGWGIITHKDGSYRYKYKDLYTAKVGTTLLYGGLAQIAGLIPCPEPNKLLLSNGHRLMTINTDGTIAPNAMAQGRIVKSPSLFHPEKNPWKIPWKVRGTTFMGLSPDGKSFYLSGIYAATMLKTRATGAEKTGFWRDGQVYKVSLPDRVAEPFFALDKSKMLRTFKERGASPIGDGHANPYAALHGVAVDKSGNVFVCDRQNKRIVILNKSGKIIRQIPVEKPDEIAVNRKTKAIYVITRSGNYHRRGELKLLKFNNWTKDAQPAVSLRLIPKGVYPQSGVYPQRSFLAVTEAKGKVLVWAAYTTLPVRIYRDSSAGLKLVKDFYKAGSQRYLDLQHMVVDPKTEAVYFADGFKKAFMIRNWRDPRFEGCMTDKKTRLVALSVAIDHRNRYLYTHDYIRGKVKYSLSRYKMDGKYFAPAPVGNTGNHAISGQRVSNDWNIGTGMSQRGIAVAPDGCVAALGSTQHTDYTGPLWLFKYNARTVPWKAMRVPCFGAKPQSGGIRFDPAGNMYAGKLVRWKEEGVIYKFSPTGSLEKGCLFPTPPKKAAKIYRVNYGYRAPAFSRTPRFGVDGYGRIYYPKSLSSRVCVIDNEGNRILGFGTWGNRDSMGGLKGDLVPTKGVPMAFPNSVDATDDYIYVSDMVNIRLLRLAKTFAAAETVKIQ